MIDAIKSRCSCRFDYFLFLFFWDVGVLSKFSPILARTSKHRGYLDCSLIMHAYYNLSLYYSNSRLCHFNVGEFELKKKKRMKKKKKNIFIHNTVCSEFID